MAQPKTLSIEVNYKNLHERFKRDMLANVEGFSRTKNFDYLRQVYPLLSSMRIALGAITSLDEFYTLRTEFDAAMNKVYDNLTRLQDKADGVEEDNG